MDVSSDSQKAGTVRLRREVVPRMMKLSVEVCSGPLDDRTVR